MSERKVTNNFCLTSTEHLLIYIVKAPLKMTIRMNYPTEDKTNFNSQSLIRCKWYLQQKKRTEWLGWHMETYDAKKVEKKK